MTIPGIHAIKMKKFKLYMKTEYLVDDTRNEEFQRFQKEWQKVGLEEGLKQDKFLKMVAGKIVDYDFTRPYSKLADVFDLPDYDGIEFKSLGHLEHDQ